MDNGRIISRRPGLTIAELSGTPYDMGLAHGMLFGPEIALMRARLHAYMSSITYGVGGRAFVWLFGMFTRRMERHTPDQIKDEIRGIADGSGQSYRFIFLLNTLDDVLVNMACSAVAIGPSRTNGGKLLVGRNLDYPLFYDLLPGLTTVFRYTPATGRQFVSVGWPGFAAVVTGMNDVGVMLADLTSISKDTRLSGTPALILNRLALQNSSDIEGLEHTFRRTKRTVGKNIMAASPETAIVLELTAKELQVRRFDDSFIVCTNHFETPRLADRQGSVKPPPKTDFPASYYSYAFSKERMETLTGLLASKTTAGIEDVITALGSEPVANPSTVQSVIFIPAERRILVAASSKTPVSRGDFTELSDLL